MSYIPFTVNDEAPFSEDVLVRHARLLNHITASHDAFARAAVVRFEHANGRASEAQVRSADQYAKDHKERLLVDLGFGRYGTATT
jgi:hypothetical protein